MLANRRGAATRRRVRSRERPASVAALALVLGFLAISAIPSGVLMMTLPDGSGFGMPVSMLEHSPFETFFVPGLLLFAFLGLLPLVATVLVWTSRSSQAGRVGAPSGRRIAWLLAGASGVAAVVWIVTQVIMIRDFHVLHAVYGGVGLAIVVLALAPGARAWART
jgi:hypothetical protein